MIFFFFVRISHTRIAIHTYIGSSGAVQVREVLRSVQRLCHVGYPSNDSIVFTLYTGYIWLVYMKPRVYGAPRTAVQYNIYIVPYALCLYAAYNLILEHSSLTLYTVCLYTSKYYAVCHLEHIVCGIPYASIKLFPFPFLVLMHNFHTRIAMHTSLVAGVPWKFERFCIPRKDCHVRYSSRNYIILTLYAVYMLLVYMTPFRARWRDWPKALDKYSL